jgi:hypothetical protein
VEFDIHPYQPGDETAINLAFNEVFDLERSLQEWQWKFRPTDGCRILVGKSPKNDVLSQYAACVRRLQLGDRELQAGLICDVFSRRFKETVGKRLYVKTVKMFFQTYGSAEQLPLLYGFPGERALRLGKLTLDYPESELLTIYRRKVPRIRFSLPNRQFKVSEVTEITGSLYDTFWSRVRNRYPYSVIRDSLWLKQRYLEHPAQPYQVVAVSRDHRLEAWAVCHFSGRARIVDICWDGSDVQALKLLERNIMDRARKKGHRSLEILLHHDREVSSTLRDLGWQKHSSDEIPAFSAMSFLPELAIRPVLDNFYVTWGDTDLV